MKKQTVDKYYTYLILTKTNKLYCGYTNDLEQRFKKHCEGKAAKFTRANKPVKIVYYEEYSTKSEAMKAERRIKDLTRKQKEELIAMRKQRAMFLENATASDFPEN